PILRRRLRSRPPNGRGPRRARFPALATARPPTPSPRTVWAAPRRPGRVPEHRHRPARPREATSRRTRRKRLRIATSDRRTLVQCRAVRPLGPSTAIPDRETRRRFPPWHRPPSVFPAVCPPRRGAVYFLV